MSGGRGPPAGEASCFGPGSPGGGQVPPLAWAQGGELARGPGVENPGWRAREPWDAWVAVSGGPKGPEMWYEIPPPRRLSGRVGTLGWLCVRSHARFRCPHHSGPPEGRRGAYPRWGAGEGDLGVLGLWGRAGLTPPRVGGQPGASTASDGGVGVGVEGEGRGPLVGRLFHCSREATFFNLVFL